MRVERGWIKVERGDTLSAIAQSFNTSVEHLMALNPSIKDPDTIYAGKMLKVPKPPPPRTVSEEEAIDRAMIEMQKAPSFGGGDTKECCCRLEYLRIIQPERGADRNGEGGNSYIVDIVSRNDTGSIGVFKPDRALYITAPPFKNGVFKDAKSIQISHRFKDSGCDASLIIKGDLMWDAVESEVKFDSFADIAGGVRYSLPDKNRADIPKEGEWSVGRLFRMLTFQKSGFKKYDLIAKCPDKRIKLATIYVAPIVGLDGECKFGYTGEYDVKETGLLSEWEAKEKTKTEGKLTLTLLSDTYEFSSAYTSGMALPQKGKGSVHTVPAKELFGNFAKWFDPVYEIAKATKASPASKSPLSTDLGKTTLFLKATDFRYAEIPDDYTLAPAGTLELGINLFDGAEIRLDLIPAITRSVDALNEVLDAATKESLKGEVKADLILTGGVSGSCKLEAKAGRLEADRSAVVSANVGVKLEAKIEAELKWLFFYTKAGADATLASAKSIDEASGIKGEMTFAPPKEESKTVEFDGDVICTGMAIYLGVYAEADWKNKSKAGTDTTGGGVADFPSEAQPPQKAKQTTAKSESAIKVERRCHFVILHEFSFKEVLISNEKPPKLSQYPRYGSPVRIQDGMLLDNDGNVVGTMDDHATMPNMNKPYL